MKIFNKCLDCNKDLSGQSISKIPKRCKSCSKKGTLNPGYINGERTKERFCLRCGVRVSNRSGIRQTKHCESCKVMPNNSGINNPMYGKRGKLSPAYKTGSCNIRKLIRGTYEYRQWRSDIYHRDDFTCQNCNIRGGRLEAHHIKSFSKIVEDNNIKTLAEALYCDELFDINNGVTLCLECHKKTDSYLKSFGKNQYV